MEIIVLFSKPRDVNVINPESNLIYFTKKKWKHAVLFALNVIKEL